MRVSPRILAVLLFVGVGMLALVVAGLLDWIVGVLFLAMEFLGEVLRNVFRRRKDRRRAPSRHRLAPAGPSRDVRVARRFARRRGRPRRKRAADPAPPTVPEARLKLLVPVTGDDPDLLGFALEECRTRRAELILLFLRPMAVIPMGPNRLPGLSEDDEAKALFERVEREADRAGVPMRGLYETTDDRAATIGEVARSSGADVVLVASSRGNRISRLLSRDLGPTLVRLLPDRSSLLIHAS